MIIFAQDRTVAVIAPAATFKRDPASLTTDGLWVMLVMALILAGLTLVLMAAKRKGLLDRWLVQKPLEHPEASVRFEQTIRLSPRTAVHVLKDGDSRHLIVESSVNVKTIHKSVIEVAS